MATNNPTSIGGSDPSVLRQIQAQNASLQARPSVSSPTVIGGTSTTGTVTGATLSLAPVVSGSETLYPQSTTATSGDAVTITSSINNDTGDVTTVYSAGGAITVNPINQTINYYTSTESGVSQIIAGSGVTITASGNNGTGAVTINSTGGGNYTLPTASAGTLGGVKVGAGLSINGSGVLSTTAGNIAVLNLDGNALNVLHGDGTWSADVTDYGNSNVANYLPTYTGNISSGNAALGNLITANYANIAFDVNANVVNANYLYGDGSNITNLPVGNIASINLDGNASNVLRGDGTFGPDANSSYGDSNVTSLLGAFGSNTIVTTGIITADGANLSNVPYGNLTGAPSLGNISSINLDGSSSNIMYGNGVFAAPAGVTLPIANGNSNFDIAALDGNATITANGASTWTFGTDGLLTFPGTPRIDTAANNFEVQAAEAVNFEANTVVNIYTDTSGNAYQWQFGDNGVLNLADGNSAIQSVPNNAGDLSGLSTLNLIPDNSTGDDRYIIVDPTGPNHIHIRAGGAQDGSNSLLFLGGEQAYARIDDFNHEVQIGAYDSANAASYYWSFGNTGTLTIPGNLVASGASPAPTLSGFSSLTAVDSITVGNANIYSNGHFAADTATFTGNISALNIGNAAAVALDGNISNVLTGNGTFVALPVINANTVVWSTAPVANTSTGSAGQAAYDSGGNLYVCVATDTWAKFTGTTSW